MMRRRVLTDWKMNHGPISELIWLWHISGGGKQDIDPALVGTAIVGTAKVVRR